MRINSFVTDRIGVEGGKDNQAKKVGSAFTVADGSDAMVGGLAVLSARKKNYCKQKL